MKETKIRTCFSFLGGGRELDLWLWPEAEGGQNRLQGRLSGVRSLHRSGGGGGVWLQDRAEEPVHGYLLVGVEMLVLMPKPLVTHTAG